MNIRPIADNRELHEAHDIELTVYTKESAATLEAFQMRKQVFGSYFLVAETETDSGHPIVGVANGVRLNHKDLSDESIKQGVEYDVNGSYFCLLTIAVHPHYQRKGVATNLLQEIIRKAKEEGLKGIVLMCEAHLISFYEKHGFWYLARQHPSMEGSSGMRCI